MHPAGAKALFEESVGRWPPDLAEQYGWILHKVAYPIVDCEFRRANRTPLRVLMDCAQWDEQAPSISLLSSNGTPLMTLPPNPSGIFNSSAHRNTGRPFICMAGSHEYHTHESHQDQPWEQFRGKPGFDIGEILFKLWNGWMKGND